MENHTNPKKYSELSLSNGGILSLESIIGLQVKVRTILNETETGEIYAYDAITNTLVLQKKLKTSLPYSRTWDFSILKISCLKEIQVIGETKEKIDTENEEVKKRNLFVDSQPSIVPVSLEVLSIREQISRKEHQAAIARKGIGVTQEAQNLFNSLSRTLPCRWEKQSIIVLDDVYIDPPYTVEACWTASKDSKGYLRVCKVLEGERQRLDSTHRGG
ncbi:hypothetical protein PNEG_00806 [Pneumocystis murina B123]|uniref:AD domain-containing protein n=1 Tax=Pneumocystis murina (strain B123) TaxID=1069680 RepID=M7NVA1_PNEMU|nr:hypothetical protein PNEG_00806 [Pneumocystis murina B123]EMR11217.1 hypothetical protein PNEG_00806 [Pneumocystis murina B123]